MDFFSRQESARRATARMLVYMVVTVLLLFAAVNLVLYGCLWLVGHHALSRSVWWWHQWTPQAILGTFLLVAGGSLLEWFRLRDGGRTVAEMMGAIPVDYATRDLAERQLLNITEEMAIASGLPVPSVHVMKQESGINAFVAGLIPEKTVLVVTRGALDHLNRDELQGVVAHEFSHILNGDTRLNMRLLAALSGILAIGQLGGFLMRSLTGGYDGRQTRNPVTIVWIFGLALWLVGWLGLLQGRLIKAAVSREREILADASGLQFTRNPEGLAGALWKIREQGSWLSGLHAEEISHLCFGESLNMQRWLATHPPIDERIEALYPGYLARMRQRQKNPRPAAPTAPTPPSWNPEGTLGFASTTGRFAAPDKPLFASPSPDEPIPFDGVFSSGGLVGRIGELRMEDLESATWLHRQLPVEVTRALQTGTGAKAVLYALIARFQPMEPARLRALLADRASFASWVEQVGGQMQSLDARFALPVVELCLPRLALSDAGEVTGLLAELNVLAMDNDHLSVFEFALLKRVEQHLRPKPPLMQRHALESRLQPVAVLLHSLLAFSSHDEAAIARHHHQLMSELCPSPPAIPDHGLPPLEALDKALHQLRSLNPDGKRRLLDLCARAVESDGILHIREYELLRVIAGLLDCPVPLLQGVIHE
ncbi:Zn-dependent protease with chaperone function [Fluviicoccus keumensis]|uniref:Zn-dependent protease with chaperone function n=1 Tax=Fluviicoccus keumensis TaxID=1435465 RepID=A0A4Q7YK36_9GAMM|nr:M48 family metalloprotease [Fluviicoccus keumensis]RZU36849.1 Zn-dependent protease with chaperone function [Fluviicoccus keumensis]